MSTKIYGMRKIRAGVYESHGGGRYRMERVGSLWVTSQWAGPPSTGSYVETGRYKTAAAAVDAIFGPATPTA